MYDAHKKPYIVVVGTGKAIQAKEGVVHSLEECGMPFRYRNCMPPSYGRKEMSIFQRMEAPLGMIVVIGNNKADVYYHGYDDKNPVLHYDFAEGMDTKMLYHLARRVGCNAANIIYGKEIREL